jgi:excisionase family DNA binding protein
MTMADSGDILLTIREACVRLRVSKTQFYRLRDRGEVRTIQVGGPQAVRVPVSELLAYVQRQLAEVDGAA